MRTGNGRGLVLLGVVLAGATILPWARGAEERVPGARRAIAPAAPALPAEVVAALQEGRFNDAVAALDRLDRDPKATDADRAYHALIRGIALRLSGRLDDARKGLEGAIAASPKGPWAAKLRAELAAVELAAGRFAEAERLARAEAETLLAGDRKDRLAEVYDAFARRLLAPESPLAQPDPEGAYALLDQGRALAQGESLRARLLFAMARASQQANNHPRAIQDFQAYLKEYPRGADRDAARDHLAESQLAASQAPAARLTWSDLARDLEKRDTKAAQDLRARALYGIATTHGIPAPPNDTDLNLGVAALRRLLAAYPSHPLAVRAAYQVGASYLARGKSQQALEAFTAFLKGDAAHAVTDDARREQTTLLMTAQFQVGQILQGQEKYDEAIAAWKAYLAKYPNGPQSADAQRAILDTQILIAQDHLRREQYAEARAAWQSFVAQNPLDARVPEVLFKIGESFAAQKKYDEAIAVRETLIGKFPGTEPAAHAQFQVAATLEVEKGNPEAAIERFKKVAAEPWQSQAKQRIAVMESKDLTVVTPRTFRSGETPHLKVATRNLEKLTFAAYKLDAEAYFRKKHALEDVEGLDVGLVAPDAEWTADVPGFARYKPIETSYDLKNIEVPGVYVVKVSDDKTLQATTLVLGSDLDAIVKTSRDQILVFAQDMKTGQGRPGARVLVSDGSAVVLDATTGRDGVLLKDWAKPRPPGEALAYLVMDGPDVAGSDLGVPGEVARGLSPRAYLYTDRPAYRPGQEVQLRGIVREVESGRYANRPGAEYRLEVIDSRGRPFLARPVALSDFGTFHARVPLDEGAPVGTYRVRLYQPGKSEFAGQFEVQAYQLQKVDLAIDLPRTVYFRGETIKADLVARYQYGTPLAGRPIDVRLPDGRVLHGATDAAGKYHVEFPTEGFAEEQTLQLVAALPQDNVAAAATVLLAIREYQIQLETSRDVYLDGESFPLRVTTIDAKGDPTGQSLSITVLKQVEQGGRVAEREVSKQSLATDPKTGRGTLTLKVDDERGGRYVVRAAGTDRFGNPVVADRPLTISGKEDATRLRLLSDRTTFKVGEPATVTLLSRAGAGPALLTWEADRILSYKVVPTREGENPVTWDVAGDQFPNFTLSAARMAGTAFHEARLDLRVERDLRVTIAPAKPTAGPGDEIEVEVTTLDQLGRPVPAELSLALVDRALLRLHGDRLPPIGPFFYDQARTGAFATTSTNTFRYEPETGLVAEALTEEALREKVLAANTYSFEARTIRKTEVPLEGKPGQQGGQEDGRDRDGKAPDTVTIEYPPADYFKALPGRKTKKSESIMAPNDAPAEANRVPAMGAQGIPVGGFEPKRLGVLTEPEQLRRRAGRGATKAYEREESGERAYEGTTNGWLGDDQKVILGKEVVFGRGRAGRPREQYVETAYWNPSVVTGKDGKARVTFRAPMALSEYRFTARGVTGADTLVGQATADLAVRKDFFVDLKRPSTLTEGDAPRFSARVHHRGVAGKVEVRLTAYAGEAEKVYPKTIEVQGDGVDEILFEPFEVPDGESVRLTLAARAGDVSDELVAEVPIRPWGVQAFASASGTARDDTTVFVGLPPGRRYDSPEMLVVVSPTLRRMIVELALGRDAYILDRRLATCILPPPPNTTADRAGDLLAAASALNYLRATRAADAPEAARLVDRIRGLVAELLTLQGEDGGWPWVAGPEPGKRPGDRLTSAQVVTALAAAESLGLLPDAKAADKAAAFLEEQFAKADAADYESRAALLHALSARHKATFEQANALNRVRQSLPDVALAYLALTFANLDRPALAGEVLGVLGPRAKTEDAGPGARPRRYWSGANQSPWHGPVETTALAALAFARVRPDAPELEGAADWLLAHRNGIGWQPPKAKGAALAALSSYYGRAQGAEDRYRLVVTVNDRKVYEAEVSGPAEGQAIRVPVRVLKAGGNNRVSFDVEGRGTFGYAVTLTGFTRDFGPDQNRAGRSFSILSRDALAAEPELDGKPLATGFGVAVNPEVFVNKVTQVGLGGRARVAIDASRVAPARRPAWERDFLILEDHLPAGATLVEGSVQSQASRYELADGVLTFYFTPDQHPGSIQYDLYGYLPGRYRALPPKLRSAYEPGKYHLGPAGSLTVLPPGEKPTDPYRPTPDELYARGKALYDAGRLADAAAPLEALWSAYTLRDDIAKDAARMLLAIHIKNYDANKVVKYFEVLKERSPELVIPFDDIRTVGRAYSDIGEHERAFLVWRATAEASYLEDARVGEVLRQRGKALEGLAFLLDLWREYPNTSSIQADFFALAQLVSSLAGKAMSDPAVRSELAAAGVTRSDLLLQSIRLAQVFLSQSPRSPLADEASLALVGDFLELEDYQAVVKLAARFAKLYPKSTFLDSFQYSEALGLFHLGRYDRAVELAEAIAKATYKDASGAEQPSPNKWQALYILGQIYDARRQAAKAVAYYERVTDRFTDAADAVRDLTRKELSLPEVSVVQLPQGPKVANAAFRNVGLGRPAEGAGPLAPEEVALKFRNIAQADVKVYSVDLLRWYLTWRNLRDLADIDLAGIRPLMERTIALGDGTDFEDRSRPLGLTLKKEGAYLVMVRGDDLYASGIVLVSPLALEVREEARAGRVRLRVLDARTKDPVAGVQVKVIGSDNPSFFSGQTDLRGVFLAEGVRGTVTAVARRGSAQYAFYRGTEPVGTAEQPHAPATPEAAKPAAPTAPPTDGLDQNLKSQNRANQSRQLDRLQRRYGEPTPSKGVRVKSAY
jgi:alpha-2-macroglobulin